MESPITSVCLLGVYGSNQNDVLRRGLEEHGVTVHDAGVSTWDATPTIAGRELPLYPMKPTLNWFGRFPSWLLPLWFLVAFAVHAVVTWAAIIANAGAVRRSDVLVVPHFGDTAVLLVKPVAVLLGKPLVYVSHNGLYCTLVENRETFAPGSLAAGTIRRIDAAIQRLSDRVIVFSRYSGTVLSERTGVPEDRYAAVYVGTDGSKFAADPGGAPDDDSRDPTPDVLYWGNFIPHHGVDTMVAAAASLPEYEFVFAGQSTHRDAHVEAAETLDADNVDFPGFLPDATLAAYVRGADLVLGPLGDNVQTRMNIGTKVVEASSLGKAIVLPDHPAPNEVFDHGESAYFVPSDDEDALREGIDAVLSDPDLRHRLERGSRSVYERYFTPSRMAAQFLDAAAETVPAA